MDDRVIKLFEDYAARVARGEEPDARDYLERAGPERAKLEALIEEYLLTAPLPEPSDDEVAAVEAFLKGETPLLELRRRRSLKREAVVARLVELLGLDPHRTAKVADYYHELEAGLLDTRRVDRLVFAALAEILRFPAEGTFAWRPRQPEAPKAAAMYRIDRLVAEPSAPPPPRPRSEEWDEVDRLFRGEPPEA